MVECNFINLVQIGYNNYAFTTLYVDVDECQVDGATDCHENATCNNTNGSFECSCLPNFAGDGKICYSIGIKYTIVIITMCQNKINVNNIIILCVCTLFSCTYCTQH